MRKDLMVVALLAMGLVGCSSMSHKSGTSAKEKEEGEEGNEQKISFAEVPAAAQRTLTDEAKGNKIDTVDKETDEGKTIYEADVPINGRNYEIRVAPDGTLLSKKLDEEDAAHEKAEAKKGGKEDDEKDEKEEKK